MGVGQGEPVANPSDVTVCVVTPYIPSSSETFIRAHVDGLPVRTVLIHGWRPSVGAHPVLSWPIQMAHKAWRAVSRNSLQRETTAAYVKAFRRYHLDAVLAEYGPTGVLTVEACRTVGIPLIVHFHGFDASVRSVLEENAAAYRTMFREAAAIIAPSRAMQGRLIALGAAADKVHHIPYGVDCRKFGGADPASVPPVMLAVGRFVEKKAPQLTIQAFALAHRLYPETRLRMVGDGPLLERCRQLASELLPEEAVTFLGTQPHEAIQGEMRRARCFVQHSVEADSGDSEGTPVAILEAGASGLPVISTRHGGIPDVIVEGETGFLVDEQDVPAMATQMTRLIREPALAAQFGLAARQRVEALFTMEASLGQLWNVIVSCITRSTSASDEAIRARAPRAGLDR
jgi:colanic acid/amylovoran biosynthesis glycosyltransferase